MRRNFKLNVRLGLILIDLSLSLGEAATLFLGDLVGAMWALDASDKLWVMLLFRIDRPTAAIAHQMFTQFQIVAH